MRTLYILILINLAILIQSCSKDRTANSFDTISKFKITINGINDTYDINKIGGTQTSSDNKSSTDQKINISDDMEAIISIAEVAPIKNISASKLKAINEKIAANKEVIKQGVTYRVVFYDLKNNYIGYVEGKLGTNSTSLELYKNKTYKWFAYSHNDNILIPPFNINNNSIPLTPYRELLYASGEYTVPNNSEIIDLSFSFERKSAAYEVVVDGRGLFGEIAKIENTIYDGILKNSSMDVLTTKVTQLENVINPSLPAEKYELYNDDKYRGRVKSVCFYTTEFGKLPSSINITLAEPTITGDRWIHDGFSKKWGDDHFFENKNLKLTVNNLQSLGLTSAPGKKFRIYATILMSGKDIAGNTWGRGNVYNYKRVNHNSPFYGEHMMRVHAGSNAYETYKTSGSNYIINDIAGEYFSWEQASAACRSIFPQGYWKLPTRSNFESLKNAMETVSIESKSYIGTINNASNLNSSSTSSSSLKNPYVISQGGNPTTIAPPIYMAKFFLNSSPGETDLPYDNVNRLTFMYFGIGNPTSNNLTGFNSEGYYWTADEVTSNTKNAYVYKMTNSNGGTFSATSIAKTMKATAKCIKDPSFKLNVFENGTKANISHRPIDKYNR